MQMYIKVLKESNNQTKALVIVTTETTFYIPLIMTIFALCYQCNT